MFLVATLLVIDGIFFLAALAFAYESTREKEPRAPIVGWTGIGITLVLALLILFVRGSRWPVAVLFALMMAMGLIFVIPGKRSTRALKGSTGYVTGEVSRYDERDMVFARNSLRPGTNMYREYYEQHPEYENVDAQRREMGGTVGSRPGAVDKGHPANIAMTKSAYCVLPALGPHAVAEPSEHDQVHEMEPERASEVVKGYARHLGAGLVGISRVNPSWAYSHRGECHFNDWEHWGTEIPDPLPYAVVICTEMCLETVRSSPHTPAHVETRLNYAEGVYITTILANWFAHLGYRATAHHRVHYDLLMVPLAIDAGLGQLGRFGYLITDELGPRVRIFAVTTDMPLVPDEPIDLGADEFCRECKKCAIACPSHSIPMGDKTIVNGQEKWKINGETCFEYWAKVGTACAICMGVCPYSRPYRSIHRPVRWALARSTLARKVFPYIDNTMYGQNWRPRPAPTWIDYRR